MSSPAERRAPTVRETQSFLEAVRDTLAARDAGRPDRHRPRRGHRRRGRSGRRRWRARWAARSAPPRGCSRSSGRCGSATRRSPKPGFVGAAVGAAMAGLRPVVDLMWASFTPYCFDQIVNQAAKLRYMSGGQATIPLVLRMAAGAGLRAAAQHSDTFYALFTHIPGLKVVVPGHAGGGRRACCSPPSTTTTRWSSSSTWRCTATAAGARRTDADGARPARCRAGPAGRRHDRVRRPGARGPASTQPTSSPATASTRRCSACEPSARSISTA